MNPYLTTGPTLVSFSGGRTSGYMLHQIRQAHGGQMPDTVRVVFANTGKEREETLRFVHECGTRWGVKIHWVEWRNTSEGFEEVGYNSASRAGEPFAALIEWKQRLPNWQERWCTGFLKVTAMTRFATAMGWAPGTYTETVGLRADEMLRVFKGMENAKKHGRLMAYPLASAKVTKADVMAFWKDQDFDLELQPHEGNCDLCFLKGRGIKKRIIRDKPELANWWSERETRWKGKQARGWFDRRDSIAGLVEEVRQSPDLFMTDDEEYDVECGSLCGGE